MSASPIVLKFGSSVLRTPDDLSEAVHEIYRYVRHGRSVIAVVSAFAGVTDRLLRESQRYGATPEPYALASWVATGEQVSAAQLTIAVHQFGVPVRLCDPAAIGLKGKGPPLESEPLSVDVACLRSYLDDVPVVVVPGFLAVDDQVRCVLFGRGGSDNTALFIGHAMGADCVLLKDVHGICERDPSEAGTSVKRFSAISWFDAGALAGKVVQQKALLFAREHTYPFVVRAPGFSDGTRVGTTTLPPAGLPPFPRPLRIVLLGLGTIGLSVYRELISRPAMFDVTRVVVRNKEQPIAIGVPPGLIGTDPGIAAGEPADLLIELIGGVDAPMQAIDAALTDGRSVVSANKTLIALHGARLEARAKTTGAALRYSAAVGGAAPMVELVRRSASELTDDRSSFTLRGVFSGACNFILDQIEGGVDFSKAVSLAQAIGYADANPAASLAGRDEAETLRVLASAVGPTWEPVGVRCSGIEMVTADAIAGARARGSRLRLLACLESCLGAQIMTIGLAELELTEFLAGGTAEESRLEIRLANDRVIRMRGRGIGPLPTTLAVMSDVFDVWREHTAVSGLHALDRLASEPTAHEGEHVFAPIQTHSDRIGTFASGINSGKSSPWSASFPQVRQTDPGSI